MASPMQADTGRWHSHCDMWGWLKRTSRQAQVRPSRVQTCQAQKWVGCVRDGSECEAGPSHFFARATNATAECRPRQAPQADLYDLALISMNRSTLRRSGRRSTVTARLHAAPLVGLISRGALERTSQGRPPRRLISIAPARSFFRRGRRRRFAGSLAKIRDRVLAAASFVGVRFTVT